MPRTPCSGIILEPWRRWLQGPQLGPEKKAVHDAARWPKHPGCMKPPSPQAWARLGSRGSLQRGFLEASNGRRGAGRAFPNPVMSQHQLLVFAERETHQNNPASRIQEPNSIHTSERIKYSQCLAEPSPFDGLFLNP